MHALRPALALPVRGNLVQNLYFVVRRLQVVLGTLLHLDGHIRVELKILGEPDCAEVAPAELLNNDIPVEQDFTHVNWVVAADLVVRHAFVLARVLFVEERVVYYVSERSKVQLGVVLLVRVLHRVLL